MAPVQSCANREAWESEGPPFPAQVVRVRIGLLLVPLLIDTGSSLPLIKRRYLNHDQDFERGEAPMAISASGEAITIFGKVNKRIKIFYLPWDFQ